jgi:hypothetical protein
MNRISLVFWKISLIYRTFPDLNLKYPSLILPQNRTMDHNSSLIPGAVVVQIPCIDMENIDIVEVNTPIYGTI